MKNRYFYLVQSTGEFVAVISSICVNEFKKKAVIALQDHFDEEVSIPMFDGKSYSIGDEFDCVIDGNEYEIYVYETVVY